MAVRQPFSVQIGTADKNDLLFEKRYSESELDNLDVCIVDSLCEVLRCDVCSCQLQLSDHVPIEAVNDGMRFYKRSETEATFSFHFGGYAVEVSSFGFIRIYADKVAHEKAEVALPSSMNINSRMDALESDCAVEDRMEAFE